METKYIDIPEWDKTFALSDKVTHKKVSFTNRYGIRLVGDLYIPKNHTGKLPAIAVCGPYGAVKEQASGLYAQTLAERGFITLAFDPSFSGESGGQPRYISSGEIYTEDYSAAVDFFMLQPEADSERIGILGICGFGGISINAACRIPASKPPFHPRWERSILTTRSRGMKCADSSTNSAPPISLPDGPTDAAAACRQICPTMHPAL